MSSRKSLFTALAIFFAASSIVAAEGAKFGVGAFPLSDKVVSMWLLRTGDDGKRLPMLLVYFTGEQNWHKRHWDSNFAGNFKKDERTTYRLVSSDVTLEIAVSADKKTAWVQNQEFVLENNNVFVVKSADLGAKRENIEALGFVKFSLSDKEPLAVSALRDHPELRAKIEQ